MILSLKTTSYTAAVFVALILGFLLLLGSRQYKSHKEYAAIIEQNEKIIFQFATIREHITESLLEKRHQQLNSITNEIENLNVNITKILQQPIIPNEYRISFAGQVDFAGIILLLRSIGSGDQPQSKIRQLNQEIRILGERLMLFDRVIVEHVKRKLVGFQNFVIGLLAIILFIVIYILLFWHGQIAMPLIDLAKQAKEITSGKRSAIALRKKSGEVAELAGSFQNILSKQKRTSSEFARNSRVLEMVHNVSESVWRAQTRDAVFVEACKGVLTNSDYVLVWIGIPGEDNQIVPVVADGSTTMSRQERDECMTALLTAAEEDGDKYDAAQKALVQKTPVVLRDILAGLPKGPFKNTPFATNKPDCIALPLVYDQQILGVINIYSIAPVSFAEEEVALLGGMANEIIFSISALLSKESNKTLAYLQAARKTVFDENPNPILVVKADGTIVEANPSAEEKLGQSSITQPFRNRLPG
jgi:PAS domain-containing protein